MTRRKPHSVQSPVQLCASARPTAPHAVSAAQRVSDCRSGSCPCFVGEHQLTPPTVAPLTLAHHTHWRQNGAMPSVQVKDVPEATHAVLRARAAAAHQSLQEYLRTRLIAEASQPTLDEVLDRASSQTGGSLSFTAALEALQEERARR